MKRILKTLMGVCLVGSVASGAILADATPASAFTAYTPADAASGAAPDRCDESSYLGARVCYNASTGYFYIYSAANTLAISFPSNSGYAGINFNYSGSFGWWSSWSALDGNTTYAKDGSNPADVATLNQGCYDGWKSICVYGGNHDHLVWWSAQPNVEFVVVKEPTMDVKCWTTNDSSDRYSSVLWNYYSHYYTKLGLTFNTATSCFNDQANTHPILGANCNISTAQFIAGNPIAYRGQWTPNNVPACTWDDGTVNSPMYPFWAWAEGVWFY